MSKSIYHNHHIIPKHAGGTDAPENIVRLTRLEHAQAHYKLWLEHGKSEDLGATVILARGEIDGLDVSGKNNPFYGKKHTPEAIEKCRNAFKGRKHTEETKAKMRKADKSYMKTEAYKQKMCVSLKKMYETKTTWNKGKTGIYSAESLKKMSEARIGKKPTLEAREKMSKSGKARVWTEEHKKNQAAAIRKYYEHKRNTT